MTDAVGWFVLGFVLTFALVQGWKRAGMALEARRTRDEGLSHRVATLERAQDELHTFTREIGAAVGRLATQQEQSGQGAADRAIAQLSERLAKMERAVAEQDLTILDTAERVAHKLQDRRRKRPGEPGDEEEITNDPNLLLARARAHFPLPDSRDAQQLKALP